MALGLEDASVEELAVEARPGDLRSTADSNLEPERSRCILLQDRAGGDPAAGHEIPDADQRFLERSWSGLRLAEGIPLLALPPAALKIRGRWIAEGWAHPGSHRLRLTRQGWLLLDGLAVELASTGPVDAESGSR